MSKHILTILNPIEAMIQVNFAELIKPAIGYTSVCYIPGFKAKRRIESTKYPLTRIRHGFTFPAGLVDQVLDYCRTNNIEVEVDDRSKEDYLMYEPLLPGITFRDDQLPLIEAWLDKPRGIIISPTGSGKTVLGFGCLSAFEEGTQIIWLCHTIDLMNQAYDEAVKFKFKSVGRLGGGYKDLGKSLTITTRQSFKHIADNYGDLYDVVVVDEVHHVSALDGEYAYILSRLLAPMRLGLTASELKPGQPVLAATGLIGPIVANFTIGDAIEAGILAIPKMKMLKIPIDHKVKALKTYHEVYDVGVVHRLERNQLIALTVKKHVQLGHTVLIMVTRLDHGDNLVAALKAIGVHALLIEGLTKAENREKAKHALNKKELQVVVCSSVWKEGINIPSLDVVFNAAGGKDVLQALGRGLRKTKDKDTLWYYDIFDPSHRYLIEHFGIRLCFYMDNNWL